MTRPDFPRNLHSRTRPTLIRPHLVILNMDFNYNSRMSQSYRGSQQQQQGRTKKKEEDPDAFMRLVRSFPTSPKKCADNNL